MLFRKSIIFCTLIASFLFIGDVLATDGSLTINNESIDQKSTDTEVDDNSVFNFMPDIFLDKRTNEVKQQNNKTKEDINTAQKDVFHTNEKLEGPKYQNKVGKKINFTNNKVAFSSSKEGIQDSLLDNVWIKWVLGALVVILASFIGVFLGKKYSKLFNRG